MSAEDSASRLQTKKKRFIHSDDKFVIFFFLKKWHDPSVRATHAPLRTGTERPPRRCVLADWLLKIPAAVRARWLAAALLGHYVMPTPHSRTAREREDVMV